MLSSSQDERGPGKHCQHGLLICLSGTHKFACRTRLENKGSFTYRLQDTCNSRANSWMTNLYHWNILVLLDLNGYYFLYKWSNQKQWNIWLTARLPNVDNTGYSSLVLSHWFMQHSNLKWNSIKEYHLQNDQLFTLRFNDVCFSKWTQLKLGQYSRWTAQQQLQAEQTTTDMILGQKRLLIKTNPCD